MAKKKTKKGIGQTNTVISEGYWGLGRETAHGTMSDKIGLIRLWSKLHAGGCAGDDGL